MAASPRGVPGENHSSFSLAGLMQGEPACVSSNSQGSAIWLNLRRNAGVCGSSTAICFSRVFSSAALFYALWLIAAVYKLVFLKKLFIALKLTAQALKLK